MSLNLSGVDDSSQNNFEEMKIINDTIDNLAICNDYYSNIYTKIGATFHQYLQKIPAFLIEKMEEDLTLNHCFFINLKNEYNTEEIMYTFNKLSFTLGSFPATNNLAIIPTGGVPSFVKSGEVMSPSELYKTFSSGGRRELVCVQFLAALNIHLDGDKIISKDAMSEFFSQSVNASSEQI